MLMYIGTVPSQAGDIGSPDPGNPGQIMAGPFSTGVKVGFGKASDKGLNPVSPEPGPPPPIFCPVEILRRNGINDLLNLGIVFAQVGAGTMFVLEIYAKGTLLFGTPKVAVPNPGKLLDPYWVHLYKLVPDVAKKGSSFFLDGNDIRIAVTGTNSPVSLRKVL